MSSPYSWDARNACTAAVARPQAAALQLSCSIWIIEDKPASRRRDPLHLPLANHPWQTSMLLSIADMVHNISVHAGSVALEPRNAANCVSDSASCILCGAAGRSAAAPGVLRQKGIRAWMVLAAVMSGCLLCPMHILLLIIHLHSAVSFTYIQCGMGSPQ